MQEYVLVVFRDSRVVIVDDTECGKTNCVFQVSTGMHSVSLGSGGDFHPASQLVAVTDTAANAPKVVLFT
jgi:hypothetical protein